MRRESDLEEADFFEEETKAFAFVGRVMPEMKANGEANCPSHSDHDCPQHPRINQSRELRSWRRRRERKKEKEDDDVTQP